MPRQPTGNYRSEYDTRVLTVKRTQRLLSIFSYFTTCAASLVCAGGSYQQQGSARHGEYVPTTWTARFLLWLRPTFWFLGTQTYTNTRPRQKMHASIRPSTWKAKCVNPRRRCHCLHRSVPSLATRKPKHGLACCIYPPLSRRLAVKIASSGWETSSEQISSRNPTLPRRRPPCEQDQRTSLEKLIVVQ